MKAQDVETNEIFCFYSKNDPLQGNFQNSVLKVFIVTPIDVLCSNFVKFGRRKISKVVHYLTKKIFAWLSSSRYCADGAQNLWGPVPNNVLRVLQISSKAVHFRQCYIQMREHHQSALQSESNIRLKPSFEPNNYISFSALTQLGGCHEDHSPCKYRPKSPSEHIWGTQPNLE